MRREWLRGSLGKESAYPVPLRKPLRQRQLRGRVRWNMPIIGTLSTESGHSVLSGQLA